MPFSSVFRTLSLVVSIPLISACDVIGDPAHETIAEICANGATSSVTVGLDFTDPDVSPYIVEASREGDDYRLYLHDIFEAAQPGPSVTPDAQAQLAMDYFYDVLNEEADDKFGLGYVIEAGLVTQSANPLDYIESRMADTSIGAFSDARRQIQEGIQVDDGFCVYSNRNIRFVDQDSNSVLFSELALSYDPFNQVIQQSFLLSEVKSDLSSSIARQNMPYFGFQQADPEDYETKGFYPTILRQALLNTPDGYTNVVMDDGNDNNLGQVEISTRNTFCTDEDDNNTTCEMGIDTRVPAKTQCTEGDDDETGQNQIRVLDINDDYPEAKRLRVETDYENQEVRIYISNYVEAIYDSDGTTPIYDPTNCEKQAVLDELADMDPGNGVRLTVIEDPFFDITYDDDGNLETTPVYTFTGTTLPSRAP